MDIHNSHYCSIGYLKLLQSGHVIEDSLVLIHSIDVAL